MKYSFGFFFVSLLALSKAQVQTKILTQWTPYSDCSATCNTGNSIRIRTRTCTPSNLCQSDPLTEAVSCNTQYLCPDYRLDDWGAWSACSESCKATQLNPTRARTRSYCLNNSSSPYLCNFGSMISYEPCNTVPCSIAKSCNSINFTFVFLLDTSFSIDDNEWAQEKAFVTNLINNSTFGINSNVDVSVVTYSTLTSLKLRCGTYKTKEDFNNFMTNLIQDPKGETGIHRGLLAAEQEYLSCNKTANAPIVILLTDGFENVDDKSEDTGKNIAIENRIKSDSILIVGATNQFNKVEIDRIATVNIKGENINNAYYADTFTQLNLLIKSSDLIRYVYSRKGCETQGFWSNWGAWSNCSAVCGATGFAQRSRSCLNPTTNRIQEDCEPNGNIANIDYMTCSPICSTFSEWSAWGECSASCRLASGPPTTSRSRTCNAAVGTSEPCYGDLTETQECNTNVACQGTIQFWGSWGSCSDSCRLTSSPTQQRSRPCLGATLDGNCGGAATTESQSCNVAINCPGF